MNNVFFEEKTEIQDSGYCPIVGGLCRTNCRFLIDVEEGCMIEKLYRNSEKLIESMEEIQNQSTNIYED